MPPLLLDAAIAAVTPYFAILPLFPSPARYAITMSRLSHRYAERMLFAMPLSAILLMPLRLPRCRRQRLMLLPRLRAIDFHFIPLMPICRRCAASFLLIADCFFH